MIEAKVFDQQGYMRYNGNVSGAAIIIGISLAGFAMVGAVSNTNYTIFESSSGPTDGSWFYYHTSHNLSEWLDRIRQDHPDYFEWIIWHQEILEGRYDKG